ncbi:hypothetical protein FJZ36_05035 [Candidatus Poribacteria bacterium]|nr:hypothetical protein [Candidatus Poribacteria bacterium]
MEQDDRHAIGCRLLPVAPTLNRLTSVAVAHSEPVPDRAKPLAAESYLKSVEGVEWVAGFLKDEAGAEYLYIVNRNLRASAALTQEFDGSVRGVEAVSRGNASDAAVSFAGGRATATLAAGDAVLLRVAR